MTDVDAAAVSAIVDGIPNEDTGVVYVPVDPGIRVSMML